MWNIGKTLGRYYGPVKDFIKRSIGDKSVLLGTLAGEIPVVGGLL